MVLGVKRRKDCEGRVAAPGLERRDQEQWPAQDQVNLIKCRAAGQSRWAIARASAEVDAGAAAPQRVKRTPTTNSGPCLIPADD